MIRKFIEVITKPLSTIAVGLMVSWVLFSTYTSVSDWMYMNAPIENIFNARVIVPNFVVGDDPLVQYNRNVLQEFNGGFTVEVRDISNSSNICLGQLSGLTYSTDEQPNPNKTTFDWYIGHNCSEQMYAGQFILETNYTIRQEGRPIRYYKTTSNVFTVDSEKQGPK